MSRSELYWLVGFWEAVGSFTTAQGRPMIQLMLTHRPLLQKVARLMGAKVFGPYQMPNTVAGKKRKTVWEIVMPKERSVYWMRRLQPHMGKRRQQEIKACLDFHDRKIVERKKRYPTQATCHPTRKRWAKGLCRPCYNRNRNTLRQR